MTFDQMVLIALVVVFTAVVCRWLLRRSARRAEDNWLPLELRQARLAFAEKTFWANGPIPIVARIDRGYCIGSVIYLAEFKTRAVLQAYRSDVIELSAQKVAVEYSTGYTVSDVAYVFIQDLSGGKRRMEKVRLLGRREVMALASRREQILNRSAAPRYAENAALCRKCAYRKECQPTV